MDYEIKGDVMQYLEVRMQPGESVYTEKGGMAWMTEGIDMETSGRGGIGKMLGRALSGESLFMTTYKATAPNTMMAFTSEFMGKIQAIPLQAGYSMIVQRDSFMCAEASVDLSMHFRKKLGAGLFGGEGFVMQKVTGPGTAFVEIAGEVMEYNLQPGQRLKIDTGHVAMYEPSVNYDIQMVKGITNMLFGGEGLFLATLTGPGRVWLQTMPMSNLARKIISMIPGAGKKGGGSILGTIIDNLG